jgi:hypothetical protein
LTAPNGDGLYPGRRKGKELLYAGKVDHGFDADSAKDLRDRLTPLIRKTQPFTKRGHSSRYLVGLEFLRNRIPDEIRQRETTPPALQRPAGRFVMGCLPRNVPVLPEPIVMLLILKAQIAAMPKEVKSIAARGPKVP